MTMHKNTEPTEFDGGQPEGRRRTAFLPAGLGIRLEDVDEKLPDLFSENRRFRLAWGASELALGLATRTQFEARWPGVDLTSLLDDGEFASTFEMISARADLQGAASRNQVRRTMVTAAEVLGERLNTPDCSINQARSAADALTRLNDALNKPAKPLPCRERSMGVLLGVATIHSPEHPDGLDIRIDGVRAVLGAVQALRCTELSEVREVLGLFNESTLCGHLTLEGW